MFHICTVVRGNAQCYHLLGAKMKDIQVMADRLSQRKIRKTESGFLWICFVGLVVTCLHWFRCGTTFYTLQTTKCGQMQIQIKCSETIQLYLNLSESNLKDQPHHGKLVLLFFLVCTTCSKIKLSFADMNHKLVLENTMKYQTMIEMPF